MTAGTPLPTKDPPPIPRNPLIGRKYLQQTNKQTGLYEEGYPCYKHHPGYREYQIRTFSPKFRQAH